MSGAANPFTRFATLLRGAGFAVSPGQTLDFLRAVRLVEAASMPAIKAAAGAVFAPTRDLRPTFDALFAAHFEGVLACVPTGGPAEDDAPAQEPGESALHDNDPERQASGSAAVGDDAVRVRHLHPGRAAPASIADDLPRRYSRRTRPDRRGRRIDLRRTLRRSDWDARPPLRCDRATKPRRLLVLIDISGSMSGCTDQNIRLAYRLRRAVPTAEIFTLGTRLSRISAALDHRDQTAALEAAAAAASDWDGGTRLGASLWQFLDDRRHMELARGAAALVISDGLERGEPVTLARGVERLARLAWRLCWATPLAGDPRFVVETAAMKALLPHVNAIADGSSEQALLHAAARLKHLPRSAPRLREASR